MNPAPIKPEISFTDFQKLDIRAGTIVSVSEVPESRKLMQLTVNFGDHQRTILAGIRQERENPAEITGMQALFVLNLPPRKMAGLVSQGMLFDIGYEDGVTPVLAITEHRVPGQTGQGKRLVKLEATRSHLPHLLSAYASGMPQPGRVKYLLRYPSFQEIAMNLRFIVTATSVFLVFLTTPVFAGTNEVKGSTGPAQARPAEAKQVKGDLEPAGQAWTLINEGALVIDVRRPGEFEQGHIEGAINIEHTNTDALAAAIGEDRDRPVVFYCGSGRRAELARVILEENGYTGIFNAGGYEALLETRN